MLPGMVPVIAGGVSNPIESIFSDGTEGFYYDLSRTDTLFSDTGGTTLVNADGGSIARANDLSGRGRNAAQSSSGARPTRQAGGAARFDGVNDVWLTPVTPNSSMTLMFKAQLRANTTGFDSLLGSRTPAINDRFYFGFDESNQLSAFVGGGTNTVTRPGSLLSTTGVAALVLSGGVATVYWQGASVASDTVAFAASSTPFEVGGLTSQVHFCPVDLYKALAIKKAITPAQIAAITSLWGGA